MPTAIETATTSRRTILAGMAAAAAAAPVTAMPAVAAPGDDTELLSLGAALGDAWAAERSSVELTDDAFHRTADVVQRILALPAHSIEGLRVKARAVAWCHNDEPVDLSLDGLKTTDLQLVHSILSDLGIATVAPTTFGGAA